MTLHDVDLSALISSRICHDLISPIGAINNGLELLEAVGTTPGPEFALVNDSASAASAKLNIFRLAFGDSKTSAEVKGERVGKLIGDMYSGSRMTIDWQPASENFQRLDIKLALLTLFCVESSLPLGGTCTISSSQGIWSFKVNATKFNVRQELWDMVTSDSGLKDTSASDVHFLLARLTGDDGARAIKLHMSESEMIVMITPVG